jgi:glycosyltransferase involved in cell wall biosynthesis
MGRARGRGVVTRRLLALHDSADFGGHERILLDLLPAILDGRRFDEVVFIVPEANQRLRDALAALGSARLRVETWPFVKRRAEPYLHPLRRRYAARVRAAMARERPHLVLLVQGRIEHLAVAARALPRDVPVVSFLPMAHRMVDMGRSGTLGDRVRRRLYRRPDLFVVPDAAVARQVARAGGTAPVRVVDNVVAPVTATREAARAALSLSADARIALSLGRMEAGQKGTDLLLDAIVRDAPALSDTTFLFVGDGPAAARLAAVATAHPGVDIRHAGWSDRPDLYLAAADVLLMPSRWEGLPLVMLEAMTAEVPLLASPIDVFATYLPPDNLADFATVTLSEAIARVTAPPARAAYAARAREVLAPRTLTASRAAFAAALEEAAR